MSGTNDGTLASATGGGAVADMEHGRARAGQFAGHPETMDPALSTTRSDGRRPGARLFVGLCAAVVVGNLAVPTSPLLLGAAIDGLGVTESMGGMLLTMELVSFAVASLIVASRVAHLSKRKWLLGATVVLLGAQLIAASAESYPALLFGRILAGGCAGTVAATVNAVIAGTRDPDRLFAQSMAGLIIVSSATLMMMPYLSVPYAHHGANGLLAAITVVLFPLLFGVRETGERTEETGADGSSIGLLGGLYLGALLLIAMSDSLIYSFSERMGVGLGIEPHDLATGMGVVYLAAIPGALAAASLDTRFGRKIPIFSGIIATAACGLMIAVAPDSRTYFTGMALKNFTIFFTVPYLLGAAAALDEQGRVAAAAAGVYLLGAGLAPAVAGLLTVEGSYRPLGLANVGAVALSVALLLPVLASLQNSATADER